MNGDHLDEVEMPNNLHEVEMANNQHEVEMPNNFNDSELSALNHSVFDLSYLDTDYSDSD